MDHKDNLLGILRTLFKWKKPILITCLLAGVGSSILVLLLPVYYKASTTFIVASPDQAKPELLFSQGNLKPEFFGNANDIDRVLTIAESNELVDFLVDSFHLYERYDINPESAKGPYYVKLAFFDRFEIIKTKRDAIQLTVEDQDPDIAAAMAKSAREQIGHITERLLKQSQQKTIEAFNLEKVPFAIDYKIPCNEIRGIYKSQIKAYSNLTIIDKVNGGKADALNSGINIAKGDYFISIDVDSIIDPHALKKLIKPI